MKSTLWYNTDIVIRIIKMVRAQKVRNTNLGCVASHPTLVKTNTGYYRRYRDFPPASRTHGDAVGGSVGDYDLHCKQLSEAVGPTNQHIFIVHHTPSAFFLSELLSMAMYNRCCFLKELYLLYNSLL